MTTIQFADLTAFDTPCSLIEQAAACLMNVETAASSSDAAAKDSLIHLTWAIADHIEEASENKFANCSAGHCVLVVHALICSVDRFAGNEGASDDLSFSALSLLRLAHLLLQKEETLRRASVQSPAPADQATWEAGRDHAARLFSTIEYLISIGSGQRMSEVADYRADAPIDGVEDTTPHEQLNPTQEFLEKLVDDPSLIPGFSSILTGLLYSVAAGFGTPDLKEYGDSPYDEWKPKVVEPPVKTRAKATRTRKAVAV